MTININGKDATIPQDDRLSNLLIKRLIKEAGSSSKALVEQINAENNTNFSRQNFCQRLAANTIRLPEFLQILSLLGYEISLTLPEYKEQENHKSFSDFAAEGMTDCKSINWVSTIIAGRDAEAAKTFIEMNLDEFPTQNETNELMLLLAASRHYKVRCKPITDDPTHKIINL